MAWKKAHKQSGATVIESTLGRCKLTVVPYDWTKPKGPSRYSANCGQFTKRGDGPTLAKAKANARAAAKRLMKREDY